MEVGAKHPHDSVVREFRGLIVSITGLFRSLEGGQFKIVLFLY